MSQWIDTGVTPTGPISIRPVPYPPIARCKCYDGDALVRDFEPCKDPDGNDGMYDHVTGEFWPLASFQKKAFDFFKEADNVSVEYGGDGK